MTDIAAAMAADAARQSVRFFASADDVYQWVCTEGRAFIEEHFAGKLPVPFETNDAEQLAVVTLNAGGRVGRLVFRYRVEPAGSVAGRPAADLHVEAVWEKPRFLADSMGAGVAINDAKWGVWNRAAQRFEKAPDA